MIPHEIAPVAATPAYAESGVTSAGRATVPVGVFLPRGNFAFGRIETIG
jgi:hypothetical protein